MTDVNRSFRLAIKRAIDFTISLCLLLLLSPVFLVLAIAVRLSSPGPIFYQCHWAGRNGLPFTGYKFRTMVANALALEAGLQSRNEMRGPAFKIVDDPRVTPLGKIIRKYSLDELPQLWSVLRGDLSLVGPRPPQLHEFARFTDYQRQKLAVKPGITCLWQIEGRHRINDYDQWVARDLEYINNWSLMLDLKILLLTVPVVFRGTGI